MGFEELAGRRVRRQHFLDPLAQVRVLATLLGEVRGPLIGREFAGGIEDFFFPISVCAHDTVSASTKDYAFSQLETVKSDQGDRFSRSGVRGVLIYRCFDWF